MNYFMAWHPSSEHSKHSYPQYMTDNIMDYEMTNAPIEGMKLIQISKIQLWKWQMDIVWANFKSGTFKLTEKQKPKEE